MRYLLAAMINIYQKSLSPDHGFFKFLYPYGYCRFYPSCSEYTKQAILKKGAVRGLLLGMWRIAKCNPLSKPRVDMDAIQ